MGWIQKSINAAFARLGRAEIIDGRRTEDGDARPEPFQQLRSVRDVEDRLQTDDRTPVILFLHDPGCPISRAAHRQMVQITHPAFVVDVSRSHDVSQAIEEHTGITHESPQVIILRQGRPVWSASHGRITRSAVDTALQAQ